MNRRERRALKRNGRKHLQSEKKPSWWLVALSVATGGIVGFCFWYFLSRCGSEGCFYNSFPLGELFCSLLFFGALPYILCDKQ